MLEFKERRTRASERLYVCDSERMNYSLYPQAVVHGTRPASYAHAIHARVCAQHVSKTVCVCVREMECTLGTCRGPNPL